MHFSLSISFRISSHVKREAGRLDDLDAGRAFDQLDLITVRGIDEDEAAAGGSPSRAIGDLHALCMQRRNRVIEALHLKGKMNEVFLYCNRSAWRKAGEFNKFVTVRDFQESQLRSARRCFPLQNFEPQDSRIELDRLIQIAD